MDLQSSYIIKVEHQHYGLRPLSLAFALPDTFTFYSALSMALVIVHEYLHMATSSSAIILLVWLAPMSFALYTVYCF